ncbi:hypothetical protein [Novosphingobium sp.]|uniref:hypothetical protein n=1 Tax=Novosphingobium sp. TaxID=1874826 RepID=UPI0026331E0B|nr:hypothetical protein [Novosphingobium sp.]
MPRRILIAAALLTFGTSMLRAGEPAGAPLPLSELMGHVMQRNAVQFWAWSATETDAAGTRSAEPRTAEQWEDAESDALTLRQLALVLKAPSYDPGDPRWARLASDLEAAASAAADAAERKDVAALIRTGEAVNDRCVACHLVFAPQLETKPPPVPL